MAPDVGEEELEAVGGARDRTGLVLRLLRRRLLRRLCVGIREVDAVRLELALKELGLVLAEVVFEHECLELGGSRWPPCSSARSISAFRCSDSSSSMSWFCVKVLFQSFRFGRSVEQQTYGV